MSYNILNKNVNFQGATQGTIEDLVNNHSDQAITGSKDFNSLSGSHALVRDKLSVGAVTDTDTLTVIGTISASSDLSAGGNISGSSFYGSAVNLTGLAVAGFTSGSLGGSAHRITYAMATDEISCDSNLTYNPTSDTLIIDGVVSGSGNISGSAFYGLGTGLTGIPSSAVTLAANSGLANSSGLIVDITNATEENTTDREDDYLLFYDNTVGLRKTKLKNVADLFVPAVTQMNNKSENRLVTIASTTTQLDGEAGLTFNGTVLAVTGDVSGSGVVSGSYGYFHLKATAGSIELGDATGLAGLGLTDSGGELDIQVSGAVKIASDKVGLTGSITGEGLTYEGGVDSISAIKLDLGSLADTNLAVADDYVIFLDGGATGAPKKEKFEDIVTNMASTGLDATNGVLTVDVSDFMAAGVDGRVLTATGADAFTGEANLTFDDNTLTFGNSLNASASVADSSGTDTAGKHFVVEAGASTGNAAGGSFIVRTSEAGPGSGTSLNANQLALEVDSNKAAKFYGPVIGDTPTASSMENNGQISTLKLVAHVNSAGGSKTGIRFQSTGTAGQMIIVIVGSTGDLVFDSTEGTCKVRGMSTDNDTMKANGVYIFISDGSLWNFIGGGAATNAAGLQS